MERNDEIERQLEDIFQVVKGFAEGATSGVIRRALSTELSAKTLRRRLRELVDSGRVKRTGTKRWTRYSAASDQADLFGRTLRLSPAAAQLAEYVRRPLTSRTPVGYQRTFLDHYRPNQTYYLNETIRAKLSEISVSNAGDRPAGTYARTIFQRLLIDLSWNSSRLEGNTYSLLETARLLEVGKQAEGRDAAEAQMLLNHKDAIEFMVENAEELGYNRYTVLNLHALLARNLLGNPQAEGRLRSISVGISGSVFSPLDVPQLIEESFDQILRTAEVIDDPFEASFFAMVHLPYLQPFEDGNKRVSRLAANIPFIKQNLSPLSFVDVPIETYLEALLGVYERCDVTLFSEVYVWAYQRSAQRYAAIRQSMGEPDSFRMQYRDEIFEAVADVVHGALARGEAAKAVAQRAESIAPAAREKFIEVAETELINLHIGNIARYRIRPSEFEEWHAGWSKD